ncbi:LOW QUALITY PROTEIN: hypothetical protein CRUP_004209 [Coryphaenoides rupestris]|nr:LOW QUALITY PROTEIN: hypothetical protein CRUP_004209 [Coryphaenoides rupestris]
MEALEAVFSQTHYPDVFTREELAMKMQPDGGPPSRTAGPSGEDGTGAARSRDGGGKEQLREGTPPSRGLNSQSPSTRAGKQKDSLEMQQSGLCSCCVPDPMGLSFLPPYGCQGNRTASVAALRMKAREHSEAVLQSANLLGAMDPPKLGHLRPGPVSGRHPQSGLCSCCVPDPMGLSFLPPYGCQGNRTASVAALRMKAREHSEAVLQSANLLGAMSSSSSSSSSSGPPGPESWESGEPCPAWASPPRGWPPVGLPSMSPPELGGGGGGGGGGGAGDSSPSSNLGSKSSMLGNSPEKHPHCPKEALEKK